MESPRQPNPVLIFEGIQAYQRSAALKAAIELEIFTAIAAGNRTADAIAKTASASTRGIRILCDYLVIQNFLSKNGGQYSLTPESAIFLDKKSPAYFGAAIGFLLDPRLLAAYLNLTEIIRTGKTLTEKGSVAPENPLWIEFARSMAPMMRPAAEEIATLVAGEGELRVLDIAAGHGVFGIAILKQNPKARVTAVDWANVLSVATENAKNAGVADRHTTRPGDAFDVDFGGPYDLVLVTNFFHHFDQQECERLMRKIFAALAPGGRCVTFDFIPNDDRVSPATPAAFAMNMLANTPSGDVYTFSQFENMFRNAGYASSKLHPLMKSPESIVISTKA